VQRSRPGLPPETVSFAHYTVALTRSGVGKQSLSGGLLDEVERPEMLRSAEGEVGGASVIVVGCEFQNSCRGDPDRYRLTSIKPSGPHAEGLAPRPLLGVLQANGDLDLRLSRHQDCDVVRASLDEVIDTDERGDRRAHKATSSSIQPRTAKFRATEASASKFSALCWETGDAFHFLQRPEFRGLHPWPLQEVKHLFQAHAEGLCRISSCDEIINNGTAKEPQ
jgi:hypothetical protein